MATARAQARARTLEAITRIGREHLATHGAAGLSLRAIARDLGVVSSAVYRYVPSRDDLLTLLVVDAYTELNAEVTAAEGGLPRADVAGRWRAVATAARQWALGAPSSFGLLYGTPVPGYAAPPERTTPPGTVVVRLLMHLLDDAQAQGCRPAPGSPEPSPGLQADLDRIRRENGLAVSDALLLAGVQAWVAVFGAIAFEVFGQYGPATWTDPAEVFAGQVEALARSLGLLPPLGPGAALPAGAAQRAGQGRL